MLFFRLQGGDLIAGEAGELQALQAIQRGHGGQFVHREVDPFTVAERGTSGEARKHWEIERLGGPGPILEIEDSDWIFWYFAGESEAGSNMQTKFHTGVVLVQKPEHKR